MFTVNEEVPRYIPEEILNLYPSDKQTEDVVLLGEVKQSPEDRARSVQTLYNMKGTENPRMDLSYSKWDRHPDLGILMTKAVRSGFRQPNGIPLTSNTGVVSEILGVPNYLFMDDLSKFPFTSRGTIKTVRLCNLVDPTGGFLPDYEVWFYSTRGYLRPLDENQIRLSIIRKSISEDLRHIIDQFYYQLLLATTTVDKIEQFLIQNPTLDQATEAVGALDKGWIKLAQVYMTTPYTNLTPYNVSSNAVTWTDRQLQSLRPGVKFPTTKLYSTRQNMVSDFINGI